MSLIGVHHLPLRRGGREEIDKMRRTCCLISTLTSFAVLVLLLGTPAHGAANGKKLIEWGVDQPSTAFLRQHYAQMEATTPFDGTVFAASTDRGSSLSDAYWGAEAITSAQLTTALADLQATHFTKFTDNFLRLNVTPYGPSAGIDWFDGDRFGTITSNSLAAAQLAKAGGAKGILIDTEQYTQQIFNYAAQRDAKTKSYTQYAAQARQRGAEIMQAFQQGYPDLTVFLALGHSMPGLQAANEPSNLPRASYGMLAPFLDGMFDAASGNTKIVDGFELGYPVTVARDSAARIEWCLNYIHDKGDHPEWWNVLPVVGADHDKYQQHISAGFGTFLDYGAWDPDRTDNWFTPADLESTLRTSLEFTDEYAWLYTEHPRWWTDADTGIQGLSSPYIDAVRNAVPEPTSLGTLLLIGLAACGTRGRRRPRRAAGFDDTTAVEG
jgi:hypothetical protein